MSSQADPYYVARDEIEGVIAKARDMHREWNKLLHSENTARHPRFQHLHAELSGDLRQIDYDLQDIAATISMVEENRARFQISDVEIVNRKGFVSKGQATIRELQQSVAEAQSKLEADKRQLLIGKQQGRAENERHVQQITRDNDAFLGRQKQVQMDIMTQQDETLEQIATSANRLQSAAHSINNEIKEQNEMLVKLDEDIDREAEKLNFVMKRMGLLLKTSDSKQLCLILGLAALMVVLIFLLIN